MTIEEQLKAEMAGVPAELPPGLARTAYQRYRRRRTGRRALTAGGTAVLLAGAIIGGSAVAGSHPAGGGPAVGAETAAYVVKRVVAAVDGNSPDTIMLILTAGQPGSDLNPPEGPSDMWAGGHVERTESFTPAGRPDYDSRTVFADNAITTTEVDYQDRTWSRAVTVFPHISASKHPRPRSACAGTGFISASSTSSANGDYSSSIAMTFVPMGQATQVPIMLRTALSCGKLKLAGTGQIAGASVVKLVQRGDGATLTYWVSSSTYLPVRVSIVFSAPDSTPEQDDFQWLPPTPANEALLNLPIPAGFKRVSPQPQSLHAEASQAIERIAEQLGDLMPDRGRRLRGRLRRRWRRLDGEGIPGWRRHFRRQWLHRAQEIVLHDGGETVEDQVPGPLPGNSGLRADLPDRLLGNKIGEP